MDYRKFKPGDIVYYMMTDWLEGLDSYVEVQPSPLKKVLSVKQANKIYSQWTTDLANYENFANQIIDENKRQRPVFFIECGSHNDIGWMAEKDLIKATKAHILLFREKNGKT